MMSKICPSTSPLNLNLNSSSPSSSSSPTQLFPGRIIRMRPMRVSCSASASAVVRPRREEESLYQLLGIRETGSSYEDIKKAYKEMARKYHPDVAPAERVEEHTQRFILVKKAYDTLSDPEKKAMYDRDVVNYSQQKWGWRRNWEDQLEGLNTRRSKNSSWGSRMRQPRP